jgi:hypothetical protein
MSKRKGSAQNLFKPAFDAIDHNLEVAVWGRFAERRYRAARDIVEGWTLDKMAKEHLLGDKIFDPAIQDRLKCIEGETIEFVRTAIQNKDPDALRKLADVLDPLMDAATPRAILIIAYVKAFWRIDKCRFTIREIRDWIAEIEDIEPPFEEAFEKSVRRLIKQLGIPTGQ